VYNVYQTPFEALRGLSKASKFLKKSVNLDKLEKIAQKMSDNDSAELMKKEKEKLFTSFNISN
jgi:hypothetical protein